MLVSISSFRCCSLGSLLHFKPKRFSSSLKVSPWPGLNAWRESPLNENRKWGPDGPEPESESELSDSPFGQACSLAELGSIVLSTSDPLTKSHLSHMAYSMWRRHNLPLGLSKPPSRPARPQFPLLVLSLRHIFVSISLLLSFCKFYGLANYLNLFIFFYFFYVAIVCCTFDDPVVLARHLSSHKTQTQPFLATSPVFSLVPCWQEFLECWFPSVAV